MSIPAVAQQPSTPINTSQNTTPSDTKNWDYLIPTIGVLASGVIFTSHVPVGMAVAIGTTIICISIEIVARATGAYTEEIEDEINPLHATLTAPIIEEVAFRGILQPLTTRVILSLVPTAVAGFAGTSFSIAAVVAIVTTSILFGVAHLVNNPRKNAPLQAICAILCGIPLGITAVQFGLPAAIAVHILHNTLAINIDLGQLLPALRGQLPGTYLPRASFQRSQ